MDHTSIFFAPYSAHYKTESEYVYKVYKNMSQSVNFYNEGKLVKAGNDNTHWNKEQKKLLDNFKKGSNMIRPSTNVHQ